IRPNNRISSFKKGIHTITAGSLFVRRGSNSIPVDSHDEVKSARQRTNSETVISIENSARNSIAHTLDGVIDFMNNRHGDMDSRYKVFKELFVICWAGMPKRIRNQEYLSRV